MPYQYQWVAPGQVIFCYVSGTQSVAEVQASVAELKTMLDLSKFPTHYIADLRDYEQLPTTSIKEFRELVSFVSHPNLGWVIVIRAHNRMISYFVALLANVVPVQYQAVTTPQEAVKFLGEVDPSVMLTIDLDAVVEAIKTHRSYHAPDHEHHNQG